MFATLFLGTILAVFLTLGAIRGDAERGLLQPVLVRPLHRRTVLLGRFIAAAGVCGAYVAAVFVAAAVITWAFGGWWPDRVVVPALQLAAAVAILAVRAERDHRGHVRVHATGDRPRPVRRRRVVRGAAVAVDARVPGGGRRRRGRRVRAPRSVIDRTPTRTPA